MHKKVRCTFTEGNETTRSGKKIPEWYKCNANAKIIDAQFSRSHYSWRNMSNSQRSFHDIKFPLRCFQTDCGVDAGRAGWRKDMQTCTWIGHKFSLVRGRLLLSNTLARISSPRNSCSGSASTMCAQSTMRAIAYVNCFEKASPPFTLH